MKQSFRFTSTTYFPAVPPSACLRRRRIVLDTLMERDEARGVIRALGDGWQIAEAVFYDRASLLPHPAYKIIRKNGAWCKIAQAWAGGAIAI